MILHLRLPDQRARDRVHGVGIGAQIAKKHGKLVGTGDRGKTDRGSNDRLRFERPAGASAFCVKSVDLAIAAAHKYQAADNGWLGNCGRSAKKSERPFQPQRGHLVSRQSGHRCWLKPAVAKIRPQPFHRGPSSRWGNPTEFCAHLEMSVEAACAIEGTACCACAASGKAAMPAIIAMKFRLRIGPCPCCVSLQRRTFKEDIQAVERPPRSKPEVPPSTRHVRCTPDSRHRYTNRPESVSCPDSDIASLHSITSSAVASSDCGTVRPSAFAVLRLIISSYLVGACTGMSAGFSPLRIRSTYPAARRTGSSVLAP